MSQHLQKSLFMKCSLDLRLPQELIDEVIGYLRGDKVTLTACSFVNRAWSPLARRLLFHSVYISPSKMPMTPHEEYPSVEVPDWSAFARTFRTQPYLAAGVAELHLKGTSTSRNYAADGYDTDEDSERLDDDDPWRSPGDKWHYIFPGATTLYDMTQVLPHLRHMHLQDLVMKPSTHLPERSVPLDSLTLKNVGVMLHGNVLWELLQLFCPRENVAIDVFWRPAMDQTAHVLPSAPPSTSFVARNWRIRATPNVEYVLGCLADSTSFGDHAGSLDVAISDELELQSLIQLMKTKPSTLKELKIDVRDAFFVVGHDVVMKSDVGDVWDAHLDFSLCPQLETIEFVVLMGLTQCSRITLVDLRGALLTLPKYIRRIRIVVDFSFFGPDLFRLPWRVLDSLICFSELQAVELVFLKEGVPIPDDEYIRNELSTFFMINFRFIQSIFRLSFTE